MVSGAVSRGSSSKNNDKEQEIRAKLVKADLIDGVVLLPERAGQSILIDVSQYFRASRTVPACAAKTDACGRQGAAGSWLVSFSGDARIAAPPGLHPG